MRTWSDASLDRWRTVGDPLADDVVATLFERNQVGAVNALLHDLIRDDQPDPAGLPVEVQQYLDRTVELPHWADPKKIDRAQRLFQTWGIPISVCLFCASLPSSYAAAKGVQVLYLTARLDTDTKRRVMETGQFLMDVMTPGGLGPGGKGIRTIQRVRLMHAAIRHLIQERAKDVPGMWDPEWGLPINQEDLAATLLAFSYVVGEPLPRLGIELDEADANAYLHTWNVIGHILGVRQALMVANLAEATELVATIRRRQYGETSEGKAMAAALVELLEAMTEPDTVDHFIPALIRHLIGDEVADKLDIDDAPPASEFLIGLATRIFGGVEDAIDDTWLMRRLAEPVGRTMLNGVFRHQRGGIRAPFAIPETLRRSWGLPG